MIRLYPPRRTKTGRPAPAGNAPDGEKARLVFCPRQSFDQRPVAPERLRRDKSTPCLTLLAALFAGSNSKSTATV
jgi:hypothetical protein